MIKIIFNELWIKLASVIFFICITTVFHFGKGANAKISSDLREFGPSTVRTIELDCKNESSEYWQLQDFPFLNLIKTDYINFQAALAPCPDNTLDADPENVRWPLTYTIANQNLGSFVCGAAGPTVTVEVFKPLVTGAGGTGPSTCVVYLGLNNWTCPPIQVIPMSLTGTTGDGYDIFTLQLNNLPPGTHQLTCACTTDPTKIPFDDPTGSDYAFGNWVGDWDEGDCPALESPFSDHAVTITATVTNDDCMDGTAVVVPVGTTQVNNTCTADGKAWFKYMITNGGDVNITATQGVGTLVNPVIYRVLLNPVSAQVVCGGASVGTSPGCLQTGDILYIEAGLEDNISGGPLCPQYGTFNLTISDVDNGVVNDVCVDATILPELNCINNLTGAGNPLACPDPLQTVCSSDILPGVWYRFDVASSVVSFDIAGNLFEVFTNTSASCVGLTSVGCNNIVNQTNNTLTYYVLVFDGGNFSVTSDFSPPANDDCSTATVLAGTITNQSNICADGETITDCAAQDDNVVWYTFTMPLDMKNASITLSPAATLPISSPSINVFEGTCAGLTGPEGFTCNSNTLSLTCLTGGSTYFIQVGSSVTTSGDFDITIAFSDNGVVNNNCNDPGVPVIPNSPNCVWNTVTPTNTTNACPESFTVNGCALDFTQQAAVYYTFTTGPLVNAIEIRNIAANATLAILNTCPIVAGSTTALGGCLTGNGPHGPLTVTPNTQYWVVLAGTTPGSYGFQIKYNQNISNDLCANATTLSDNVSANGTTACATPFATPYCGLNTTTSHTVFYQYTVLAGNTTSTKLEFTITPNTATTGAAATDLNIGLFTDCGGTTYTPNIVAGDACNPGAGTFIIDCVAPGQVLTIAIGSNDGAEGDFSINANETNVGIPINDLCSFPTTINFAGNCIFTPVNGTTLNACPETTAFACNLNNFPTVWYRAVIPSNGIGFGFRNLVGNPNINIFNNNCTNPIQLFGTCITTPTDITTLSPGSYLLAVRNTDPGAAFSFEIKTILSLANDNPCEGGFIPVILNNATPLPNQSNSCATEDNICSGNMVENSLWYKFTLPAGFDRITINLTGLTSPSIALYEETNPCNLTPINEECNGDGTVEFNCLQPGTYSVMVGTSAANAGTFTITAIQGNNAGPTNDFCFNATPINIGPADLCVQLPFTSSTINACPETLPNGSIFGACNFNTEETSWYVFTAPGQPGDMPNMDFTFTGYTGSGTPFMNLFYFNANCSALTPVENQCFQGLNTPFPNIGPLTPGQQYLIGISSIGDTGGNFNFNVKFNVGPPNDDRCHTAAEYNLDANGSISIANGLQVTNNCSGQDYVIPGCPALDSENSVWFTFRVNSISTGIDVEITQPAGSSNPLTGNIAAGVFLEPCGGSPLLGQTCFPVNSIGRLDCLPGGLLSLQISSSALNAGDFNIRINQVMGGGMCNGQPIVNDICNSAEVININGILCEPVTVSGCNNNSCPEIFDFNLCGYSTNPTVWYQFTVDPDVSSVDIRNMTNGFKYGILLNSPCTDDPVTGLANFVCLQGDTDNIPVTGGETYYMLVQGSGIGGNFSFDIIQNVFPVNDNPNPAGPFPPFVLGLGGSHGSTTCCALGFNDENAGGQPLDLPNVTCSGSTHDGAVWYRYTTGDEIGFKINVVPSGLNPITGPVTVEVLSGSITNPSNALFTPTSVSCGQAPATLLVGCFDPGEEVWIKVASANGDCGNFTITISEIDQCPLAEECPDIQAVITTNPTDPNCGDFTPVTSQGCLEAACPETEISICGAKQFPTVWFQVEVDDQAVQLGTSIFSNGSWDPVWSIHYGGCGSLTPVNGGTIDMPSFCSNGDDNADIHTVGTITDVTTYYIAVSGEGVIDDPTFTLNVWTSANCVSCVGEPGCNPDAIWSIASRSSDRALDDPKFCPGEEVRVCINYRYDASETGVDWFHGLIPNFGPGWDMTSFDPTSAIVSPGNAVWRDENDGPCAPYITEQMPYLCTYLDPVSGSLKLCNTACQACPCAGPLLQGSPLPGGWFWNTNGGGGCPNDCSPATHYGIGSVIVPDLSFCVDLKVRTFTSEQECIENRSLQLNFQTTSDGVSGCWEDPIAECKLDYAQLGPLWEIECTQLPVVLGQSQALCKEGFANLVLTNTDGNNNVIIDVEVQDNPNVTGENNHIFIGFGTINDFLVNTSDTIQVVSYIAKSQLPGVLCTGRSDTFLITLYPAFTASTDRSGTVCSVDTGNGATNINLFGLLQPNYTINGNWVQVSPLTPTLVIPASGIVDFSGLSVGTIFTFEYHKSASDTCSYIPATVQVTVSDCDCPDTEIHCINCNLCNDSGILNLSGTIVNPATIGPGTWKVTGPANINIPLSNGTVLNATGLPAGLYVATYTLNSTPSGNCPAFDSFSFSIRNKATALIKSDTLICNGSLGIQRFPLSSLFISGDFGSWVDANNQPVTDLNPSVAGFANGSVLNYTYVVTNSLPCTNSRYPVTIRITDNCNCEPINLLNIPTVCTSTGNLDLKTFSDPKPGIWTATNPLLVINNGVLTLTGIPAGTYQLRYTLTNPVPGCLTFATRNVSIVNPRISGMALPAQFCTGDPGSLIQLRDFIEGEDSGGIWTMTSSNNTGFNAAAGTFNLSGRPAGTYLFRYSFPAQAPCQDEFTLVTVNISSGPTISAGNDIMVCEGETVTLNAIGNGTTYVWSDAVEQNKSFIPVRSGYYTVSATDANGCAAKDSVFILILDESQNSSTADDTIYVSAGKIYDIDLALNDDVFSDSFNITIGDFPSEYIRILTLDTKGKMHFEIKESFFETIIIDYELCDLCDQCATGRLFILDEKLKDIILTTIITPTQATNSKLQFSKDPIPDTELWIYNRWGQQIHHSRGYQNDWDADGYPGGVYYYVFKLYGFTIKRALTVVK